MMGVTGWGDNVTLYVEADFSEAISRLGTSIPATVDTLWDTDYWDDPEALWESTETVSWSDITEWVQGISTNHGFSRQTTRYNASTASVRLVNTDGRFSPNNVNSPYRVGDSTAIGPLRPFRIRAEWTHPVFGVYEFFLFTGLIQSWNLTYDYNRFAVVDVELVGIESQIASFTSPALASQGGGESAGDRINRILTNAGFEGTRYVDTGLADMQATTLEGNALSELQLTADSEGGAVYWGPDGSVYFDGFNAQIDKSRGSAQFFFTDQNTNYLEVDPGDIVFSTVQRIAFQSLTFAYDGDLVRNVYNYQRVGGAMQTADDQASRQLYGDRGDVRTDLICTTDADVSRLIERELLVSKFPEFRVESITFSPLSPRNSSDEGAPGYRVWLWLAYGAIRLRQGTFVYYQPPGEPDPVRSDVFIESISHSITPSTWEIKLGFSSATVFNTISNTVWDYVNWDEAVWSW
jgi:hypothetical protein